ncbi:MAG: methyltransferase domain-containing protein [Patescibacteria group bacterium]
MKYRSGTELINPFKLLERAGIKENYHVADLGCGSLGHFIFPASQLVGGGGAVYAVDILREVVEQVKKEAKEMQLTNVFPVWADIDVFRATKIDDASLDLTLLINNLYLSQNRPQLLREMARLTKPGGKIVIVEWKASASPIGPAADARISKEDAKEILKSPLITLADEFEAGEYHYGLIYSRTNEPLV